MVKPHYDVGVETQTVQIIDDFIFCNTIGATSGRGTAIISGASKFIPKFCGVGIDLSLSLSLVICVVFSEPLFVLLSFFFWPLHCLFFYRRLMITPLISSNFS
jgi:hypothetical protein